MGVPSHNSDSLINNVNNSGLRDGVHPTSHGYRIIAQEIFNKLLLDGKIKKDVKIICYGDSITFGVHVAGEGTTNGETYPAFLKRMIYSYFSK